MLYILIIALIALSVGSLIYIYRYNKSKYLIGLIYGFVSIGLLLLGALVWYAPIFIFIIGIGLVYFFWDWEIAKGALIGAIIGIISLLLFIAFNIGAMVG